MEWRLEKGEMLRGCRKILGMRYALLVLVVLGVRGEETVRYPFPGVMHVVRQETKPRPFAMHVVKIDLRTPGLRFKVSPPGGTREAVRQTTLDFLELEEAQIAVNLHFFLPFPSAELDANLVGLAASEGNVYSDFETPEQSYAIVADAPGIALDRENRARIVRRGDAEGLWNAFAGSAQVVTGGRVTVPEYRDESHPKGALTPGGGYSNAKSWYAVPNARTLAGLSPDRRFLYLVTIDRAGQSQGLTLGEAGEILVRDYGVHEALNLDGGGSTTLAMEHPVTHERTIVNVPSAGGKARSVATSLAVFVPMDRVAPKTVHTIAGGRVTLEAVDEGLSTGVDRIFVSVVAEHAAVVQTQGRERTVIELRAAGAYEIEYFARDHAGNVGVPQKITVHVPSGGR